MTEKSLTDIPLVDRACEACGTSRLREIVRWEREAATRTRRWKFVTPIVCCEGCGFTFLSPCFSAAALEEYYADSYARFGGQALDFSPEKRLDFIDEVCGRVMPGQLPRVIELGGNADTPFQAALRSRSASVSSYELNAECRSDYSTVSEVPDEAFDLVLHYFILEHIPEVRAFLRECRRMLRVGGAMIVEVPDLMVYPRDVVALCLYEHCNHFTVDNLRHLAALEGFRLICASDRCSRSYGFSAAFEKLPDGVAEGFKAECFERNLGALGDGVARAEGFNARVAATLQELHLHPEERVVFWGANDHLLKMFPGDPLLPNAVLVDSDPRKANFHPVMPARQPGEVIEQIRAADRLVLFTQIHAQQILDWIAEHADRRFESPVILSL